MKQMNHLLLFLFIGILWSCGEKSTTKPTPPPTIINRDTGTRVSATISSSSTSLDWQGVYKGTVPCADCEGIDTELTLNSDMSYTLKTKYLGKKGAKDVILTGRFSWDSTGNIAVLDGITSGPNQYKLGENFVRQLDMSGNEITGELADRYILRKL